MTFGPFGQAKGQRLKIYDFFYVQLTILHFVTLLGRTHVKPGSKDYIFTAYRGGDLYTTTLQLVRYTLFAKERGENFRLTINDLGFKKNTNSVIKHDASIGALFIACRGFRFAEPSNSILSSVGG